MDKVEEYRAHLQQMCHWESYLLVESRLPGPRANLELARAVADEGDEPQFLAWLALDATAAPANSPGEFLPFCGALGLGRLLAEGDRAVLPRLSAAAHDPRWRIREAVAMALQRWGAVDMPALLDEVERWVLGSRFEQRAIVAALCEPALLHDRISAGNVLGILDRIMATVLSAADRQDEGFSVLRKALGYGWSVAVAAAPESGKAYMEKWVTIIDPDVRWIMRENLSKARLSKMDAAWVELQRMVLVRGASGH